MSSFFPSFLSAAAAPTETECPPSPSVKTGAAEFEINPVANEGIAFCHAPGGPLELGAVDGSSVDFLVHPISSSVKGVSACFRDLANRAGPKMVRDLKLRTAEVLVQNGDRLHTSDVVMTVAGQLSFARMGVLHVVTPAFTSHYQSAMINSLSSCYLKCLEAVVEAGGRTVCFAGMSDRLVRGGMDQAEAFHVEVRTLRRFLAKYNTENKKLLDRVILVSTSEEAFEVLTKKIAPLYFPRSAAELAKSREIFDIKYLRSPGDSNGGHRTRMRRIRIGGAVVEAGSAASPVVKTTPQRMQAAKATRSPPPSVGKQSLKDFPRLQSWAKGKVSMRVTKSFNHVDSGGSAFTIYELRIGEGPAIPGFSIWRRYSEFRTLHDAVVEEATMVGDHATLSVISRSRFPPKVWFGAMDMHVVGERRRLLDAFIRNIGAQCSAKTLAQVRAFCVPTDADVARQEEMDREEEDEDVDEDNDTDGSDARNTTFVRGVEDPHKRDKASKVQRRVFADLGTGNPQNTERFKKTVAKPDPTLKIRRDVKKAASGKMEDHSSSQNIPQPSKNEDNSTLRQRSGGRIHRTSMDNFNMAYQAEGNRFIFNDDL